MISFISFISFIIPAHNEELLIGATLDALKAAADDVLGDGSGDAPSPYEIILVNDASTDNTAAIAEAAGARVVSVELRQIAAVRNAGAREATGDLLVFVDADTIVSAAVLRSMMDALDRGAIGGGAWGSLDADTPAWARLGTWVFMVCYFGMGWAAGCFLFARRAAFDAAGGFDEQYYAGEEMYLSRALKRKGRFVIVRDKVTTSGRKFRSYPLWKLLAPGLRFLYRGNAAVTSREGLGIWYEGKRD